MRVIQGLCCLAVSLAAAAQPPAKGIDLSGTWQGSFTLVATGLALKDLEITLRQSGTRVDGTLLMPKFRSPLVLKGTFSKGRLHLVSPPTRGLALTLDAKVQDPRRVKGTALLDYDSPSLAAKRDRTVLEMSR